MPGQELAALKLAGEPSQDADGNTHFARRLRRKGREAKESRADPTDYTTSPTARSFVPFYAQRLSTACVLNGARAIQKSLKRRADHRRSAAMAA